MKDLVYLAAQFVAVLIGSVFVGAFVKDVILPWIQ